MDSSQNTESDIEVSESEPFAQHPSLMRRAFRNRFSHWRAGWRLLVYAIAVFVVGKSITTFLKLFMASPSEAPFTSWAHSVIWVVTNCALVVGAFLLLRFFDGRPFGLLGLSFNSGWLRELIVGLVAGVGATGLLVVLLIGCGSVSISLTPELSNSLASAPRLLFILMMAATVEELLFRGYPLQVFAEGSRRWIAGALFCVFFTWAHGSNPDVTAIGIINIFLASVVLTVLYFQTRRLWLPIAFHLSWNFSQSWLWGFDVSGIKIEDQLFVATPTGSELVTGGEFGLEGSILSTVLFVAVVVWFLLKPVLRPTEEVSALWAPFPAGFGLPPTNPLDGYTAERLNGGEAEGARSHEAE